MIKFIAKVDSKGYDLLGIGLSHMNLKKLKQDKPIHINLNELGSKNIGEIMIFAGETEQDMVNDMQKIFNLDNTNVKPFNDDQ